MTGHRISLQAFRSFGTVADIDIYGLLQLAKRDWQTLIRTITPFTRIRIRVSRTSVDDQNHDETKETT